MLYLLAFQSVGRAHCNFPFWLFKALLCCFCISAFSSKAIFFWVTLVLRVLKNALFSAAFSSALPVLSSLERCYSLPWGQHTYYKPQLVFTLCCRLFKLLLSQQSSIIFAPSLHPCLFWNWSSFGQTPCCIMGSMILFYDSLAGFVWMAGLSFLNSGKHLKFWA